MQRWPLCGNSAVNVYVSVKQRRLKELSCELWMIVNENSDKKNQLVNPEKFCFRYAVTWKIAYKPLRLTGYCFIKLGVLETLFSAFVLFHSYHTEFRLNTIRHKPKSERMISDTMHTLHKKIPYLFFTRWYPSEIKLMFQKLLIIFVININSII